MATPLSEWIANKLLSKPILNLMSEEDKKKVGSLLTTAIFILVITGLILLYPLVLRTFIQEFSAMDSTPSSSAVPNQSTGYFEDSCWSLNTLNNHVYKFNHCTGETTELPQ